MGHAAVVDTSHLEEGYGWGQKSPFAVLKGVYFLTLLPPCLTVLEILAIVVQRNISDS